MEEYFRFSKNKEERFLELILFAHLATIYCDSHLCDQEKELTKGLIRELVSEGYDRGDIELKAANIEKYILTTMQEKTKDFIMIFDTSIKQALPPAETELYNKLAHIIMKGALVDDKYKEQERRLFQHFRKVVVSVNREEEKKMDYGTSFKPEKEEVDDPDEGIYLLQGDTQKTEDPKTSPLKDTSLKVPVFEFSFVDDETYTNPRNNHLQKYEDGIPDDVSLYESDQLNKMEMVTRIWDVLRKKASDSLHVRYITSLTSSFVLDGCMYGLPVTDKTEIFIVGDLHGCYNNLKAVLWQTDFINKVNEDKDVYLVLLGDFFDRGIRTLDGIMPLVLQLVLEYPERVIVLRGNHEHFMVNEQGIVQSAVRPCETISFWQKHLSNDFFRKYMAFFEQLPLMAFFSNGIIAVHGGIPPAGIIENIKVLHDFNTLSVQDMKRLRYSVLWTDPGEAEDMPINMKAVFHAPFGKKQFRSFMEKIGAHLLIRGHEAVQNGCECTYPGSLMTVFSAGGKNNPHAFAYNEITPRFLRITSGNRLEAVKIRWEFFADESSSQG
ncbi:MAG: serine/threonine protein phosphatase [Spirochaetales bacterium]|nr:serine/threonine protein phosphatase [Spirochaetales bacterium]